jgi:N-acetyl sugar amidotransferase
MKRCTRCVMPDTRPGLRFDENGVCQACLNHDKKATVDWDKRFAELEALCDKHRKPSGHDCIIAVSGGKDSHFQTALLKERLGMHPLLVSVGDNMKQTEAGKANFDNLSEEFGSDIICLKPNLRDQKIAMRHCFEKLGKPTLYIDILIYSFPLIIAEKFGIDLVIYGEDISHTYGGVDDEEKPSARNQIFNGVANLDELGDLRDELDLTLLTAPPKDVLDKLEPIYLSYYVPWSSIDNFKFAESRGFRTLYGEWIREGFLEDFDQIDSIPYLLHPLLKMPKFGHSVASDYASKFVREGHWSRQHALEQVELHDGKIDPKIIEEFCKFLDYEEKEVMEIIDGLYNPELFDNIDGKWVLKE